MTSAWSRPLLSRAREPRQDASARGAARSVTALPRIGAPTPSPPSGEFGQATLGERALRHADALYDLACHLTRSASAAEDLVQETFARALGAQASFSSDGNLKAWLFKILRNAFIDATRRRRTNPTYGSSALDDSTVEASPSQDLLRGDIEIDRLRALVSEDIEAALGTLSPDSRTVILLDLEGFTEAEMTEVMGWPAGTIKSRLSRARKVLRERLREYER
jgi:RNA polymerase sigma-70 factor (ECF subfamily)